MSALLVGFARCSTDKPDLTAQRDALLGLGVEADRIYVEHGLTGTNRERPGCVALAACPGWRHPGGDKARPPRPGPARSACDRRLASTAPARIISASAARLLPTGAVGRLLFGGVRGVRVRLIRLRTREGMKVAKAKGRAWRAAQARPAQEAHLVRWCTAATTAPPKWANSSASAAPRSTAPSNADASTRELGSWRRRRGADAVHGADFRTRDPGGTPAQRESTQGSERPLRGP